MRIYTALNQLLIISEALNLLLLIVCIFLAIKLLKVAKRADDAQQQLDDLRNKVVDEKEQQRATARRRYISREMRERILKRDNYTCQICGISYAYLDQFAPGLGDYLALNIDHVVPVSAGGSGQSDDNLQVLCWRCNNKKSNTKTNAQVKASINYGIDKLVPKFVERTENEAISVRPEICASEPTNE